MTEHEKDTAFLLGQIVADIKHLKSKLDELTDGIRTDIDDHETRLTKLEGWKREVLLVVGIASMLFAAVANVGVDYVKHRLTEPAPITQTK